ncbi:SPFH domain-containing protein [Nocardia puris]|uniref:Regulator of protease activity HflC (Stomatin/prohibitin superfamily) n=1 Tax=Nocardia puris TaxID=208602 RepID=A0A366DDR7_9NOCA|nr:SPFH domain-containing protein [Nocardia puris]RBO87564.1 regulator of protease activity HflC (stomatin/prohibitin superfamily) [Nocardia puris]
MPWLLTISIILVLVAAFFANARRVLRNRSNADALTDEIGIATFTAAAAGVLAVLLLGWSCVTMVSTRNVGIITSFNKPVGTLSNGLHLKWPWQKVPELTGSIQTDNHVGGWADGRCDGSTPVRLANNSTACVDHTVRWRIVPDAGDTLYRDYRDDNTIRDSLVTRELNATLNAVFSGYDPLDPKALEGPNLTELSETVTTRLRDKIGTQIDVQNVIISIVHFDATTQDRINALQAQIANTRIAEESQRTAEAQAEANRALASSVSADPNVLVARCLELVNSGKSLPAGFQCWPGTAVPLANPIR